MFESPYGPVATKRISIVENATLGTDYAGSDFRTALASYDDPIGNHDAYWYVRNIDLIFNWQHDTGIGETIDIFDVGRHVSKIRLVAKGCERPLYDIELTSLFHALVSRQGKWTGILPEAAASETDTTSLLHVRLPIMGAVGARWTDTAFLAAALESLQIQTVSTTAMTVTGGTADIDTQQITIKADLVAYPHLVIPQPFTYEDFDPGSTTIIRVDPSDRLHLIGMVEDDDANVGTHRVTLDVAGETVYSAQRLRELQMAWNHECLQSIDAIDAAATPAEVRLRLAEGNATWQPLLWEPLWERRLTKARRGRARVELDTAQASTMRAIAIRSWAAQLDNPRGNSYMQALPLSIREGRWEPRSHNERAKPPRRRSTDVPDVLRRLGAA